MCGKENIIMKKGFVKVVALAVAAVAALALASCAPKPAEGKVTLVSAEPSAVKALIDSGAIDYAVNAEPAVSVLTANPATGINRLFDIQSAWSGGFPQAVLLVKNSLAADGEFVERLLAALTESAEWLPDHAAEAVTAISECAAEGYETTLSAAALSQSAIAGCNIRVQTAADAKSEVETYLNRIKAVESDAVGNVADEFFFTAPAASAPTAASGIKIFMPDGAPALAFAKLMHDKNDLGVGATYTVVNANNIGACVAQKTGDAVLLPVTAASKLAGSGADYKLVSVNTHGNLFVVGKSEAAGFALKDLVGKKVGVIQLANVPGLTFRATLDAADIAYEEQA